LDAAKTASNRTFEVLKYGETVIVLDRAKTSNRTFEVLK